MAPVRELLSGWFWLFPQGSRGPALGSGSLAGGRPARGVAAVAGAGQSPGQVARTQAPLRRARPLPTRRLIAAVRCLSQAWFLAVPR